MTQLDPRPATYFAPAPEEVLSELTTEESDLARERGGFWRALGTGISAGILALVVGLAVIVVIVPHAAGATNLTVLTGSMRPHLPPGTLLVVKPKPIDQIRIGDVITYEPNPDDSKDVVSHRVIAVSSGTDGSRVFTVKGDANNAPDAPVRSKQVVATLWYAVPYLGWVNAWMGTSGSGWLIPAVAVALMAYAAWNFIRGGIDARRKSKQKRGRRRAETA